MRFMGLPFVEGVLRSTWTVRPLPGFTDVRSPAREPDRGVSPYTIFLGKIQPRRVESARGGGPDGGLGLAAGHDQLLADLELVAARVLDAVPVAEVLEPHPSRWEMVQSESPAWTWTVERPFASTGAGFADGARATGRARAGSFSTSAGFFFWSSPMRARATASLAGAPERRAMAVSGMTSSVPGFTRLPALSPFIWMMVADGTP